MTLTLRRIKGSALTYDEMDDNFMFTYPKNENRIINSTFDIWQRGVSSTLFGYVTADRWLSMGSGGTITQSRGSFPVGTKLGKNNPKFFLRHDTTGQLFIGSNLYSSISQRIEGVGTYAGETITVLGWARISAGFFQGDNQIGISLDQVFGTGGTPSAEVLGSGTVITLNGGWQPFAAVINVPSISGKTVGTNGDDYLALNIWTSAGSALTPRSGGIGVQNNTIDFWGIHIRTGVHSTSSADLFEAPDLSIELARCHRYYYRIEADGAVYTPFGTGWNVSTVVGRHLIKTPTKMRKAPTLESAGATRFVILALTSALACTAIGLYSATPDGALITTNVASGLTAGQGSVLAGVINSTEAWIALNAEI